MCRIDRYQKQEQTIWHSLVLIFSGNEEKFFTVSDCIPDDICTDDTNDTCYQY